MSLKAVSLHNIPNGTPIKDFVKFQFNCTLDSAKIPPSVNLAYQNICSGKETKRINDFQSTLISDDMHRKEFLDISEIKASSEGIMRQVTSCQETKILTRRAVLKRKACESLPLESPGKIFLRMKQRAALLKEKSRFPEVKLLDSKITTDCILTPERHPALLQRSEKIPLVDVKQVTMLDEDFLEESNVNTVSVTNSTTVNKNIYAAVTSPPFLESPNKFFCRVKQSLQKAKQPLIASHPTNNLNNFNECLGATVSQKKKITVEPAELANETFTILSNPVIMSDDHVKSREFMEEGTYVKLSQEKAVVTPSQMLYSQKGGENLSVSPEKPSQHQCDIIFATPKVHIPRKRTRATKVLLDEPDTGKNTKEKQVIRIKEWSIKVINNNTAVCVEGKRSDMEDVIWHSNVLLERIAHNQVKTLTGSIYMLEGYIDVVNMKKEGIPTKFIQRFGTGIPINWKMHVDNLLQSLKRNEQSTFSVCDDRGKKPQRSEELDLPQNTKRKPKIKDTTHDVLPLQNDKICGMQMKTIDLQNDHNQSFTRSGRRVKPPMLYWCGERICLDHALNVSVSKGGINYLSPPVNSLPPQNRQTSKIPEKNGKSLLKDQKKVPSNQAKGKINMKSENITRKTERKSKQKSQQLISPDSEENTELAINDIYKKRAIIKLTPLNKNIIQEKQQRPRNEQNVTKELGKITCYERNLTDGDLDPMNCPLNLLKSHQQIEEVVESVPCTDEDKSSEEIPCIKRKTRPSFKRETSNKKPNTQKPPCEPKRTENCIAPSQSKKTKCSYSDEEDTLEELRDKSFSSVLGAVSGLEKRNRQKSQKWFKKAIKNALASESESESSIEEFSVKESRVKIPTNPVSTSPKSLPVIERINIQRKLGNAVKSLPDMNENWTEEELQKLYRAVTTFSKCKSSFWLEVAKTVRTRSAEECQQKYMAKHERRKRAYKKITKPEKKEEKDSVIQQPLARVGTLKRKLQMRKFLEQMPKDNHDNVLATTPFQNMHTKLPQFCLAPEEDIFQLKDNHPVTPASATLAKTPQCDYITSDMLESLDRKDREKRVFHMQKRIKGKERTWQDVKKKSAETVFTTPMSRRTKVFHFEDAATSDGVKNLFEVEQGIQSDEENDTYFST